MRNQVLLLTTASLLVLLTGCCCPPAPTESQVVVKPDGTAVSLLDIVKVDASVMDRNNVYTKYSYVVTVNNNGPRTLTRAMTVELIDANDMIIDKDIVWGAALSPGENKIRGDILSSSDTRDAVDKVVAKFR